MHFLVCECPFDVELKEVYRRDRNCNELKTRRGNLIEKSSGTSLDWKKCFWHKTSASLHPHGPVRQWGGVMNTAVCAALSSLGGIMRDPVRRGTHSDLSFPVCFIS